MTLVFVFHTKWVEITFNISEWIISLRLFKVGVIFDESNEKVQKRYVEITMVFHVVRGIRELLEDKTETISLMNTKYFEYWRKFVRSVVF